MCYKSPFCFVLGDGSTSVNRSGKGVIGTRSSAIVKQVERKLIYFDCHIKEQFSCLIVSCQC